MFVELMGGEGDRAPGGRDSGAQANGKSVVTANKALLARSMASRSPRLAERNKVALNFEAGGRRAQSRWSRRCARGSPAIRLARVYGILNGTCNYMPDAHGAREAVVRRVPEGRAAASATPKPIRRSTSRGTDTAQKLVDPRELAFGTKRSIQIGDLLSRASPRSPPPISKPPTSSAIASSSSASR